MGKRITNTQIHREISTVCEPCAKSSPAIGKWLQQFENVRTDITDAEREKGPAKVSTQGKVQRVEEIIL